MCAVDSHEDRSVHEVSEALSIRSAGPACVSRTVLYLTDRELQFLGVVDMATREHQLESFQWAVLSLY